MTQIGLMQAMLNMVNQIYNKEFTARLVPSAATGRVVNESLDMYATAGG